jgi:outer membrane protein
MACLIHTLNLKGEVMKNLRHWFFTLGTLIACSLSVFAFAQQANSSGSSQNYVAVPQQNQQVAVPQQNLQSATVPIIQNGQNSATGQTSLRIGIVNTKKCLEESKLGRQEQANVEKMKGQMQSVLQEKERELQDIQSKLDDDDYMDSISDEAASELKRKKRAILNEGMQLQSQYSDAFQKANLKIIQRLTDVIGKASAQVAQDPLNGQPFDIIFTDEACTYYSPRLDLSDKVVGKMNAIFDAEQKENASKSH